MTTKFAIIAGPRTGSSTIQVFLEDLGVFVYREPFRPEKNIHPYPDTLNEIYFKKNAVGLKHVYTHVNIEENIRMVEWLYQRGITTVLLTRRNKFHQAVSLLIAKKLNIWAVKPDVMAALEYRNVESFEISISEIEKFIEYAETIESAIMGIHIPDYQIFQTLYYEAYFNQDSARALTNASQLVRALGITAPDYIAPMIQQHFAPGRKQNTEAIYRLISNRAEIEEHFGAKL